MHIGPYNILGEIGRGGMGVVYKAANAKGEIVAIKMIAIPGSVRAGAGNDTLRMSLVREARLASTLEHQNILKVHDIGQHRGHLFIVMEYLDGAPLNERIRSLSVRRKMQIIVDVCDALEHAHARGVVHRDIKPANTFLLRDGTTKIVDFGLAVLQQSPGVANKRAGTIPYMSPEQCEGKGADAKSDIWSTGVMLYQVLTGRLPFIAATAEGTREKILTSSLPPVPVELTLSRELSEVLQNALAKDRNERFASAEDFSAALRILIGKLSVDASDDLRSRTDASLSAAGEVQGHHTTGGYSAIEIGLPVATRGTISIIEGRFLFVVIGNRARELAAWPVNRFMERRRIPIPNGCLLILIGPLFIPLLFIIPLLVFCWWSTLLGASYLSMFLAGIGRLRCRSCRVWMMHSRSRWTRFVQTNTEVVLAYRDSIAALREDLWIDAAKLLTIHGGEYAAQRKLVEAPLRYSLEFYECNHCGDQAARLSTDERAIDSLFVDKWHTRSAFTAVYKKVSEFRQACRCPSCWLSRLVRWAGGHRLQL